MLISILSLVAGVWGSLSCPPQRAARGLYLRLHRNTNMDWPEGLSSWGNQPYL